MSDEIIFLLWEKRNQKFSIQLYFILKLESYYCILIVLSIQKKTINTIKQNLLIKIIQTKKNNSINLIFQKYFLIQSFSRELITNKFFLSKIKKRKQVSFSLSKLNFSKTDSSDKLIF